MKPGYVYMMASGKNGTIYIGVTGDLVKRVWEHRESVVPLADALLSGLAPTLDPSLRRGTIYSSTHSA